MKPFTQKTYIQLVIAHIILAMVVYFFEITARIYFYAIMAFFLHRIITNANRNDEVLLAAAYVTGFEVFSRMTDGIGISYEFAKFTVIGLLFIGMFYSGFKRKAWPYALFIFLLIPGILFSAINLNYETNFASAISFNLSGPVCLAVTAIYCFHRNISKERFQEILIAILLPIIAMTAYLYVYTPNIRDVLSGTQSNYEASGGFGPNQVATILGLGMFILFTRLLTNKSRLINIVDLILLAFVSYRGIVTFSRGGIITAALCASLFFIFYFYRSDRKVKTSLLPRLIFIAAIIAATWVYTSVSTFGLIDKRYSNQDAAGRVKQDITTGRAELLKNELEAFYAAPFTGIGVGKIKEHRLETTGRLAATHNEMSRVISEHGLFGIFAIIVLVLSPAVLLLSKRRHNYLLPLILFWFLTINHSSMRIAAPAFIYGLALITLVNEKRKNTVHREQALLQG